ncbi:hypothetical protein ACQKP0_02835 [Heyndrickxia sp. NPDC080065]|uniref:hypothetical protein n=1 Tax=Heyndrickxia sp. NPDC080065 TaxID=3390568 RepID=UPI003D0141E4
MLSKEIILYERMKRQSLLDPIDIENRHTEYIELFRLLQPVAPVHFTRPGDPPRLVHRTNIDDFLLSSRLREKHRMVKGRFIGGRVGYVLQEDLKLYATVFRKTLKTIKPIHEEIIGLIKKTGGISKEQLKGELPYTSSEITKALQSLQEAFLVYEDQVDTDWDTGWFDFATEWFEINVSDEEFIDSLKNVILNFLNGMVFASEEQIKSWSSLSIKVIRSVITVLQEEEKIALVDIKDLGKGYMRSEDVKEYKQLTDFRSVFMLDKSDFLVRANMSALKEKYKGYEVLQYLLIDGEFKGAVIGHWRIGPYDLEDIVVEPEVNTRKEEIIEAIRNIYPEDTTAILKYNGEDL